MKADAPPAIALDGIPVSYQGVAKTPAGGVSTRVIYAYGLLAFAATMIASPILYVVPQLYAKELGISLAGIGSVVFITRLLNVISDQVLGYLSDKTKSRFGPRKPWIVGGTIMTMVASYFLLSPPATAGLLYFAAWKILFDIAWTAKTLNYTAWGAELSPDYYTRSRISGVHGLFGQLGNMSNDALPILFVSVGLVATSAYSLHLMRYLFAVGCVLIPLFTVISLTAAPSGRVIIHERETILDLIKAVRANRPFWYYFTGFSILGVAQGAIALIFTFYDSYLKVGASYPYLMTGFYAALALFIPAWTWLSKRIGKHKAFTCAALMNAAALQVFWFIPPDTTPHNLIVAVCAIVTLINGAATACYITAPMSILADVIDYGEWKSGSARAGSYFGLYLITTQAVSAVGAGLGFMALAAFGYSTLAGAVNTPAANLGLMVTIVLGPGILCTLAGLMMWRFPLDERRQGILRRRLDRREAALLAKETSDALLSSPAL
jgi:Na+/melibiose symporter-like transporter